MASFPTVPQLLDPNTPPVSAGKIKALWDAVRSQPLDQVPAGQPNPQGPAQPIMPPPQPPVPPQQNIGTTTATGGGDPNTPPAQVPGPSMVDPNAPSPLQNAMRDADPNVQAKMPALSDIPATAALTGLQQQQAMANAKPSLAHQILGAAAPLALAGLGAAFHAPSVIAGAPTVLARQQQERESQRQALTAQVDAAQRTQAQEFDAAQRAVEQANAAAEANRTRQIVASTGGQYRLAGSEVQAGGRQQVAETQADARQRGIETQGQTQRDVAQTRGQYSYKDAIVGANGRIQAAKYAVDAALLRQDRGFNHQDTKPTADEDRRDDMAQSLNVMADRLEEITARRPDLVGKFAGRATKLRSMIGTSDPDVAEMNNIRENLGQLALSAHSMRNANHIATAADSMVNSFYNSPDAMKAGLESAKRTATTMETYHRPTLAGQVQGQGRQAPAQQSAPEHWVRDASGKLVQQGR